MADGGTRSVAEKLAAAKKKHKAYLKEKVLKNNVNNIEDSQTRDTIKPISAQINSIQTSEYVENISDNVHDTKHVVDTQVDTVYSSPLETDFPLPQYSMDYNSQHQQSSSLPDPLSFFDNFSGVGATFQNITQPLASFFNNSSNSLVDETIELPNQILVEENSTYVVNPDSKTPLMTSYLQTDVNQQGFSYDRFKSNAITSVPIKDKDIEELKSSFEKENFSETQIFDNFTNANGVNQTPYIFNQEKLHDSFQNKSGTSTIINNPENTCVMPNNLEFFQNKKENVPIMFEVQPDIVAYSNNDERDMEIKNLQNTQSDLSQNVTFEVTEKNRSVNFPTLQIISNEMDELIKKEENAPHYSSTTALDDDAEKRNKQLQELLDCQISKYASLSSLLQESEIKHSKLLTDYKILEIQKEDSETDQRLKVDIGVQNELSKLREDLQCHLQTIGLLVAEKTELSALLSETRLSLTNESSQRIDAENKMKGMQAFYSSLENELESIKSEKININSSQKEQTAMFNKMQEDYNQLKHQHNEIIQDLLESKEKLKSSAESNATLERHVKELSGQLSLANIKIQQLTLGEDMQHENQLDQLMQEKFAYEKQLSILNDTLKTITKEREESSTQYQQYAEQLNIQITNLAGKLEQYQKENEQLRIQEENRIRHIGELEKQLQNIQNDNNIFNLQRNNSMLKKELEAMIEMAEHSKAEKEELNGNLTKALVEKELLEKDLDSCKVSISQFESTVEQLRGSQPDNAVLLATMESDKVAASRAISQNIELKKQMDGMQEVLLKVNNDNVQLTENVSLERRTNKDLFEKLQKTEISLQTLAQAIEIKDKELVNLREELEKTNKQVAHQEQLSDRLRHYEAQDYGSSSLQNELQDAKHMIAHLTNELNILKKNQLNQTHQMNQTVEIGQMHQDTQTSENNNVEESISETPDLTNELKIQLNNLQIRNRELESLLQNLSTKDGKCTDANRNENLDKETAMRHLEKKFLRTMEEIARLTEEKHRLEHLVLQLQGETETIGEYVTLYQQQRSILKQRALEKDEQLQQLTNDRETIKANLDRLNSLVSKLIVEKGAITKELMEQHEHFTRERDDLCEEHQKIHQEINKITSDGFRNSGVSDNANTEVAAEIMSLLSEIKSSNLVQPAEGIHHCPWCSGKLITV